ncbi:MAG: alanine racemase [Candidatus Cyclobacteriaceae bacterium M3_2C_046]
MMLEHTSTIEICRSALGNNVRFLKRITKKNTRISSVVKGNAYGHGIEHFVPLAMQYGIDHFSVFSANEANRVYNITNNKATIMIMGMISDDDISWAISHQIQFYVFEFDRLFAAIAAAKTLEKKAIIHLELETGMNRLGFNDKDLPILFDTLKKNQDYLQLEGLCTHYAGAESIANFLRIRQQIEKFEYLCHLFNENDLPPRIRHSACSAATISFPETHMDMVRIGILLYGFWPSPESHIYFFKDKQKNGKDPLKRIISWKSKIMSVKQVNKGEFIGYGTSYLAAKNMTIGVVPVGYAYGYSRNLSNLGRVLIHGKRTGVLGLVNMNLMIVDLSDIKNVSKGDEVVLIGKQKHQNISVASFSEMSHQLNYEMLTRLPTHIPRIIIE